MFLGNWDLGNWGLSILDSDTLPAHPSANMTHPKTGVLVMAYGSAPTLDDEAIRRYLTHILQYYRGVDPTRAEFEHLKERYQAVGGSPLYPLTEHIVDSLQEKLSERLQNGCRAYLAMKHSPPYIEESVERMAREGITRAAAVALAPFRSRLSTDGYYKLVRDQSEKLDRPIQWSFAGDWNLQPRFLDLWTGLIRKALGKAGNAPLVVFTNHSLPARIRQWRDPYPDQFEATAAALAERSGLSDWTIAYQSRGGGDQPWLGPDLCELMSEHHREGRKSFLAIPIGFLMDHLETLYDLDVEAAKHAKTLGIQFSRTAMPNDHPLLVEALAEIVENALANPD